MNRQYTREKYLDLVQNARKRIPGVALTTDVLVGFPGETESDFQDTCELLECIRFDEAYTYRYSPREGTQAALLADELTEKDRLERLDEIIHLQRRITLEIKREMIGHTEEILPETASKQSPDEWMGRSPTNHVVVFPKNGSYIGYPVNVVITECRGATLRGHVES
jgi:tRNA-2-methylthio-N6-dimethylallyladenosine synthase